MQCSVEPFPACGSLQAWLQGCKAAAAAAHVLQCSSLMLCNCWETARAACLHTLQAEREAEKERKAKDAEVGQAMLAGQAAWRLAGTLVHWPCWRRWRPPQRRTALLCLRPALTAAPSCAAVLLLSLLVCSTRSWQRRLASGTRMP